MKLVVGSAEFGEPVVQHGRAALRRRFRQP
jgi:hypothetical protein